MLGVGAGADSALGACGTGSGKAEKHTPTPLAAPTPNHSTICEIEADLPPSVPTEPAACNAAPPPSNARDGDAAANAAPALAKTPAPRLARNACRMRS
jgi:hypothetical protein